MAEAEDILRKLQNGHIVMLERLLKVNGMKLKNIL